MQATKGLTGAFRWHGRLGACCLAMAIALCAAFATSAHAEGKTQKVASYLALGDSLAFGYSQELYNAHEPEGDPAAGFNKGYAQMYFKKIDKKVEIEGRRAVKPVEEKNLACPGETTASFIGHPEEENFAVESEAELVGSFGASTEAPCAYQEAWSAFETDGEGGPLHFPYYGESQLHKSLKEIFYGDEHEAPVKAITIDLGANDELHLKNECASAPEGLLLCLQARAPHLIEQVTRNLVAIIYTLRHGSLLGWHDYAGPIIFVATYDPFGTIKNSTEAGEFPPGCSAEHDCIPAGEEYLYDSNLLAAELASHEKAAFGEAGLNVITVNLQETFNPASLATSETSPAILKHLRNQEAFRLKKWTNMTNAETTHGKADGPDIHPTKIGYREIAKLIYKKCHATSECPTR